MFASRIGSPPQAPECSALGCAALLVIESVIVDERPDPRAQTLDILTLTVPGGRERTASQFRELFQRAGLRYGRVVETAGPLGIVEATAA